MNTSYSLDLRSLEDELTLPKAMERYERAVRLHDGHVPTSIIIDQWQSDYVFANVSKAINWRSWKGIPLKIKDRVGIER